MSGAATPGRDRPTGASDGPASGGSAAVTAAAIADPLAGASADALAGALAGALAAVPTLVVIVAEAAWISVVAGLFQAFALHDPVLGIPAFAVFVAAGVVAARVVGRRLGPRWPPVAVALTLGGGVIGWLAAPEARDLVAQRGTAGLGDALAANPGGLLAAVAVLRGFAQARIPADAGTVAAMLAAGIPGIAVAALLGGMTAEPWRERYLAEAQTAAVVFLAAGVLALALARLTAIGAGSGFDWRRNPSWIGLLVLLVLSVAAIAVPLSLVTGPAIQLLLGLAIGPLLVAGLVLGFDRRSVRLIGIVVAVLIVFFGLARLVGDVVSPSEQSPTAVPGAESTPMPGPEVVLGGAGLLLVLGVLVILVLARLWMGRVGLVPDEVAETRTIDRGESDVVRRPPRRWSLGIRRRPEAADAVTAYRQLLEDLEARPAVRRHAFETPAEHARRLRREGHADLALDLLAADYALARFGGVALSLAEERRALARARALRRRLRSP